MKYWILFVLGLSTLPAQATDLAKSFPKGKGSRFELKLGGGIRSEVMVYVANSAKDGVAIETYLSAAAMGLPVELWLQSRFDAKSPSKIEVRDMFTWLKGNPSPERVPVANAGTGEGLQLADFMLRDAEALKGLLVGAEQVEVPAGNVKATHYRQKRGGDTVDFWISDEAAPLGLVKLEGHGKNAFGMQLLALISNVQAKIDPHRAVAMTPTTQALMQATGLSRLFP